MGESYRPPRDSDRRFGSYRPAGVDAAAAFDQYRPRSPPFDRDRRDGRRDDRGDDRGDDRQADRRDDRRDDRRYDRRDDRRENYRDDYRDRDSYSMYQFRGDEQHRLRYSPDSYRPNPPQSPSRTADTYRPNGDNFSFNFRYDAPATIDMTQAQSRFPTQPRSNGRAGAHIPNRHDANRRARHGRDGFHGRGGFSRKAADRPFLKTQRAPTPERMAGMEEEETEGSKYRTVEDMSDSDETDMDVSSNGDDDDFVGYSTAELPKKKQARTDLSQVSDGDAVPRWSNPDPYTALPPPDESQKKKKDVVKLIRKARVVKSSDDARKPNANADDFISFDFDDNDNNDGSTSDEVDREGLNSVAQALPQSRYSHRDNIHSQIPSPLQPSNNSFGKYTILEPSSDPALGSRKRTHKDEIKGPPRYIKKPVSAPARGPIVKEWIGNRVDDPVPWCINDHSRTVNMGHWLHKEIVDFYSHVKPREFEQTIRDELIVNLRVNIQRHYHDAEIFAFGSFPARLYLPTADMDLVMVSNQFMQGKKGRYADKRHLFQFQNFLQSNRIAMPQSIEIISRAKVPLVKYVDRLTGLKVDISFENDTGIIANDTFKQWREEFPAMPVLVTVIKQFLTMRGLNEPVNGGIGGFSVICLVVSLLQLMPQVQSKNMIPEHNLGEILMEFFDLYGNEFDTMTTAIQLKPPAYLPKNVAKEIVYKINDKAPRFSIIDPNNSSNDIAGGSSNTKTITMVFSEAFTKLQHRMSELRTLPIEKRTGQSILGVILAGDYCSFDEQRAYLAYLHSQ
ncbi:MAG: hypothetical protein M1818_000421 [Claussenomyces sp. TS43310]|nr:MAG: hypothetical protein M1818_000421 [Claussenomyces sp. TS43310]